MSTIIKSVLAPMAPHLREEVTPRCIMIRQKLVPPKVYRATLNYTLKITNLSVSTVANVVLKILYR